ncbi:Coiled-coil domain-containing protein [Echinococcus granulosus]|uniref:Cilia- and flagella-associated protein 263 n=1 Tax=Echinococcus granulosus TaxID=6210 RepID=W6URA4_ECHGR|nr:Coiled-coil domain-containing protein [Echinococcus granulosus]EUB63216.1 Coiled-coil domain-containing protein [Echinococcus granulosus]
MEEDPARSDAEFDDYSVEFLQGIVDENTKAVEDLEFENFMLDRYIKRFNIKLDLHEDQVASGVVRSSRNRSRIRNVVPDRALRLNPEQKCTIAKAEIENFSQELITFKRNADTTLDDYRALCDEAELELKQIEQLKYNYQKFTRKKSYQPQNLVITAEKITRFMEEVLRSQDTLVDKYRLNNSTLRFQRRKLLSQQKQKEEMGEVLHEVDFEQLKIENAQFLEIIDGKNQELLRLKLTAGRVTQASNALKRKLAQLNQDSIMLQNEIKNREEIVAKTTLETTKVIREKQKIEAQITHLNQLMEDYRVPPVMDYVNSVREIRLLKRKAKVQSRKLDIAKASFIYKVWFKNYLSKGLIFG